MLPTIITTTLVRGAQEGERHGGIHVIDLETEHVNLVLDWNTSDIDWSGRGGARGIRGIAVTDNLIYFGATDEIFVYGHDFQRVASYRNQYLKDCHEIHLYDNLLYITSTRYDSLLVLDIDAGVFIEGYCIRIDPPQFFDPTKDDGPAPKDSVHLNSVYRLGSRVYIGCNYLHQFRYIEDRKFHSAGWIPTQTHNAQPFRNGILYNHTGGNRVVYSHGGIHAIDQWSIPMYDEVVEQPHCRQGWARGLCTQGDLVITGFSPATIMVYDLARKEILKTINLSMNVRCVPHGLCIYEVGGENAS